MVVLQSLASSLWLWRDEIARMWQFTKSNAITDGLHNKMEVISRARLRVPELSRTTSKLRSAPAFGEEPSRLTIERKKGFEGIDTDCPRPVDPTILVRDGDVPANANGRDRTIDVATACYSIEAANPCWGFAEGARLVVELRTLATPAKLQTAG